MTDHSGILKSYQHSRAVRLRLGTLLAQALPPSILGDCARILGFLHKDQIVLETEDEIAVLMDYCLYYPQPDGRNTVKAYLDKSRLRAGSDERNALEEMTRAYYSIFQVVEIEKGVGAEVKDLFRVETDFLVDVGLSNSARLGFTFASRIIPFQSFLSTGGAALPVDEKTATRLFKELFRTGYNPAILDFKQITPEQEAKFAAIIIRECRAAGMSSRIAYATPGESPSALGPGRRKASKIGRNERCPCGSGRKYKVCCALRGL